MRENGEHTGKSRGGRGVDAHDPGVGVVGVAELGVELSGQVDVGGVPPEARHLFVPIRADKGLTFGGDRHIPPIS